MSTAEGFTLIELLIVVAIMSILAVISVPAGYYWVQNAKISSVKGNLSEAVGRAKGAAIRNQRAALAGDPVAAICISETSRLYVLEGTTTQSPDCEDGSGTELWTSVLADRVTLTSSGDAVTCMCFDNLGILITNMCTGCLVQPTITLAINDLDEEVFIY